MSARVHAGPGDRPSLRQPVLVRRCAAPVVGVVLAVLIATPLNGAARPRGQQGPAVTQVQYAITDLGLLPDSNQSFAVAVNASGTVMVRSRITAFPWPPPTDFRTFLWNDGVQTDLGFIPLGMPSSLLGYVLDDVGQVVGSARGQSRASHAFMWNAGTLTDLGTLPGYDKSAAMDLNDARQVVGISWRTTTVDESRAFLWMNGSMTDLGTLPGGGSSVANSISNAGQIVGAARIGDPVHAITWINGVMIDLGTFGALQANAKQINDAGHIMGRLGVVEPFSSVPWPRAFLYKDGVGVDLGTLGGLVTQPSEMNNSGHVVGSSETALPARVSHAFLYRDGTLIDVVGNTFGGWTSTAMGINSQTHIVGQAQAGPVFPRDNRAFLYRDGTVFDLNELIPPDSGWDRLSAASDINDAGQIVGWGAIGGVGHAFRLDPIP